MDNSFLSHVLTYITSAGFLGISYYAGKLSQRLSQLEDWKKEHGDITKEEIESLQHLRIDVVEIKQQLVFQSERLNRLSIRILGEQK